MLVVFYMYMESSLGVHCFTQGGIKALLLFEFPFVEDDMCEVPYSNF